MLGHIGRVRDPNVGNRARARGLSEGTEIGPKLGHSIGSKMNVG